ncbi:hypothetical protein BHM03_00030351 [Ensete ventricosum]|nr:hypothetical protein BHM03_00030351 [Ensete ventricosum]
MDPVEWWIQFGGDAPHLRKVAIRILSQTTTSSGCERNWSTFALIHTKVRNRLSYKRLEKLVYVHYNMRLKFRCAELDKKEPEELDIEPIDLQLYNEDFEPMLEWVEATENQEDPLLDEAGDPQRPSRFIIEAIEEEAHPQQVEDPPQPKHDRSSHSTSYTELSQSSTQRAKAKKKGKAVASATPLERIESGDEAPSQSIQGHDTNTDSSSSTDNGGDTEESYISTT